MAEVLHSEDEDCDLSDEETVSCMKLELAEHIASYLENRELLRDTEPVVCDSNLVDKVICNYIIAKQIISNLSWQDKLLCKHVCTTWHSAVLALKKEQLGPEDFVLDMLEMSCKRGCIKYKKSGNFYTEPLVVLTFANTAGFNMTSKCQSVTPAPCTPPCEEQHCLLDMLQNQVSAPKDCMLTVRASYVSYMPLAQSVTHEDTITSNIFTTASPFLGGLYIPTIPDVEFHIISVKSNSEMQKDFFDVVDKISQTRIFKGVLVYVTDKYLLHSVEEIVFLNYFKDVQPDIPYALGGCIVEDAMYEQSDINHIINGINKGNDFISENLVTIGLFTVPKVFNESEDKCSFDMYSLIIESSDWTKPKILQTITQFSKEVPRFEHSVVLKLSCVGRDQKHELEQDYFRAAFPNTRLIGCYGNGELGVNHPARPVANDPKTVKRHRHDPGPQFGIMYSYSTVFLYIGWGKKL